MMQAAQAAQTAAQTATQTATTIGTPDSVAIAFFAGFISLTLAITYWAAKRTTSTEDFYAAGRTVTAGQNGIALAGDYMSAGFLSGKRALGW